MNPFEREAIVAAALDVLDDHRPHAAVEIRNKVNKNTREGTNSHAVTSVLGEMSRKGTVRRIDNYSNVAYWELVG